MSEMVPLAVYAFVPKKWFKVCRIRFAVVWSLVISPKCSDITKGLYLPDSIAQHMAHIDNRAHMEAWGLGHNL